MVTIKMLTHRRVLPCWRDYTSFVLTWKVFCIPAFPPICNFHPRAANSCLRLCPADSRFPFGGVWREKVLLSLANALTGGRTGRAPVSSAAGSGQELLCSFARSRAGGRGATAPQQPATCATATRPCHLHSHRAGYWLCNALVRSLARHRNTLQTSFKTQPPARPRPGQLTRVHGWDLSPRGPFCSWHSPPGATRSPIPFNLTFAAPLRVTPQSQ